MMAMELGPFEVRAVFSDKTLSPAGQPVGKLGGLVFPYLKAMKVQMPEQENASVSRRTLKAGSL